MRRLTMRSVLWSVASAMYSPPGWIAAARIGKLSRKDVKLPYGLGGLNQKKASMGVAC